MTELGLIPQFLDAIIGKDIDCIKNYVVYDTQLNKVSTLHIHNWFQV